MRDIIKARHMLAMILMGIMASSPVLAHGPSVRFGVVIGGPVYHPWYYPAPYYYYPPPIVAPSEPPTYIERGDASEPEQQRDWFYCANPQGYYPYVKKCPAGWQRVAPQPPDS